MLQPMWRKYVIPSQSACKDRKKTPHPRGATLLQRTTTRDHTFGIAWNMLTSIWQEARSKISGGRSSSTHIGRNVPYMGVLAKTKDIIDALRMISLL